MMTVRFLLLALVLNSPLGAAILRVDPSAAGLGDGSSWADAYTDLHAALAAAGDGDEIWLRAGTYRPAGPGGDRTTAFNVTSGVTILGGFDGTENSSNERNKDPETNGTILSGDLNGDGNAFPNDDDNSHHVVTITVADVRPYLAGLTIRDGHANGSGSGLTAGAGVYILNADPSFEQVIFRDNRASTGAGVYNGRGGPIFYTCQFLHNDAGLFSSSGGGGMSSRNDTGGKFPQFYATEFRNNYAVSTGGALELEQSNALIYSCDFTDNVSNRGGAVYCFLNEPEFGDVSFSDNTLVGGLREGGALYATVADVTMTDVTFTRNGAPLGVSNGALSGGAIHGVGAGSFVLTDVTFDNNRATAFGGAVSTAATTAYVQRGGAFIGNGSVDLSNGGGLSAASDSVVVVDVVFRDNETLFNGAGAYLSGDAEFVNCSFSEGSAQKGGALYSVGARLEVVNCAIFGNRADSGGGIHFTGGAADPLTVTGVTFADNDSVQSGGGIRFEDGVLDVSNSIFWQNKHGISGVGTTAASLSVTGGGGTIASSIVQGSNGSGGSWAAGIGADGGGNLDIDPEFVDDVVPDTFPQPEWDLRLRIGSPGLDAGSGAALPPDAHDLDGDLDLAETLPLDLAARPRMLGAAVDIGPYEGGHTTFALSHPGLDPDHDDNGNGASNFIDYACARNPETPGAPAQPIEIFRDGGNLFLRSTLRGNGTDVRVTRWWSFNLQNWNGNDYSLEDTFHFDHIETALPNGDLTKQVDVFRILSGPQPARFFRWEIEPAP